jgi:hypothetical protein
MFALFYLGRRLTQIDADFQCYVDKISVFSVNLRPDHLIFPELQR